MRSFWSRFLNFTKPKESSEVNEVKASIVEQVIMRAKPQTPDYRDSLPPKGNYSFSKTSRNRLKTCHPDIRKVIEEAILYYDFAILEGSRPEDLQNKYFMEGTSKVRYPNSYHNTTLAMIKPEHLGTDSNIPCSLAIDVAPYPINWRDTSRFVELARIIKIIAKAHDIPLEWGFDKWGWDAAHFQLTSYRKGKK